MKSAHQGRRPHRAPDSWIEVHQDERYGDWVSIRCPVCRSIVHLQSIERFGGRAGSSGRELSLDAECEGGHRFLLKIEDHSGCMALRAPCLDSSIDDQDPEDRTS